MTQIHLRSAQRPFTTPRLAFKAARVLAVAESTGLWSATEPVTELDAGVFKEAVECVGKAGVAAKAGLQFDEVEASPDDLERFLDRVFEEIYECPVPEHELPVLESLFGADELAELLATSETSLRRYLRATRDAPDDVADRAHFLALVTADLAGSYNERGIVRWFRRPRRQLGDESPQALLAGSWSPDDEGPRAVAAFASEISGASLSRQPA